MFDIIYNKIQELKELDTTFTLFGAEAHNYVFNDKLSEIELLYFEGKNEVKLPENYRTFLTQLGNGGCGPNSGILKLENGIYDIPLNKKQSEIITLKNDFRFDKPWNLESFPKDDYDTWEKEYDAIKWTDGMLRISHLGCCLYANLIITGKEKGNIWIDSRTNEQGIYPANKYHKNKKNDFLSWYLNWLEISILELKNNT